MGTARRFACLVVAAAAACLVTATPASAGAPAPRDGVELLQWIAAHRDQVALSATDGTTDVSLNAGRRVPLASVYKVLLLVAYAERVTAHRLDPAQSVAVSAVERWYWPGTDGGAHTAALAHWRTIGATRGSGPATTVSLDDVVTGMIRFSDNASADYILERIGVVAAADVARRHGMRTQDVVQQKFGEYVAARTVPAAWWRALPSPARSAASLAIGHHTPVTTAIRLPSRTAEQEGRFYEHGDTQGTASQWQRLWSDVEAGRAITPAADAIVRRHAEWQQGTPVIDRAFAHDGYKGGSFATVLNMTGYEVPRAGPTVSYALFLHALPPGFVTATQGAALDFVQRLALDPAFYARAASILN